YDPAIYNLSTYDRYARDLLGDRFYKWLERPHVWRNIQWAQWLTFWALGALVGGLGTGSLIGALQLSLSWLVWGVFVRTVVVWHLPWSVPRSRICGATAPLTPTTPAATTGWWASSATVRAGTTTTTPSRAVRPTATAGGSWMWPISPS